MRSYGRYFEEFTPGETIVHPLRKTVFESDNNLFSLLTMNHHPAHLDQQYAETSQHGQILVVGTYVFSLVVGLTVGDISGQAIANLDYEKIDHRGPVYIGDTISASTEIITTRLSKTKSDRGIIYVETTAHNQREEIILVFRRHVLVRRMK